MALPSIERNNRRKRTSGEIPNFSKAMYIMPHLTRKNKTKSMKMKMKKNKIMKGRKNMEEILSLSGV